MDQEDEWDFHIHFHATSWPETFKKGVAILELATQHPDQTQTLSACAAILMSATLEQGTWARLDRAAALAQEEGEDPKPYAMLISTDTQGPRVSLKDRIQRIPGLLTKGRVQFNGGSYHARYLEQLISFRNWLLHTSDSVRVMTKTDPRIKFDGDTLVLDPKIFPANPWDLVTLKDARNFCNAVSIYMREVIKPDDPDDIVPGEIVK